MPSLAYHNNMQTSKQLQGPKAELTVGLENYELLHDLSIRDHLGGVYIQEQDLIPRILHVLKMDRSQDANNIIVPTSATQSALPTGRISGQTVTSIYRCCCPLVPAGEGIRYRHTVTPA